MSKPIVSRQKASYKLVAFDVDGTLIQGLSFSWTLVWDALGYSKDFQKAGMQRYLDRQISYQEWCEWACRCFMEHHLTRQDLQQLAQPLHLTQNCRETIRTLKQSRLTLVIVSGGIDVFLYEKLPDAERLFDYIFINRFLFDSNDHLTGVIATEYDFEGKIKAIETVCSNHQTSLEESVFVGDAFNDEDVIQKVGLGITYRPQSSSIHHFNQIRIHEDNLSLILPHILN